jgi:hypothetical protein
MGYSRITLARNAIGLALATEKFGSKFFSNGANVGIAVKHPSTLSDPAFEHLGKSWKENYQGVDNAHKFVILEEGMSLEKIGIPPEDAQFLETRKFQVDEIARMFRIPPHMLGNTEKSSSWGTGIEQQELGYLSHTLRPWLKRIEQQAHKDLLLEAEKRELLIEHLVEDFLRTDITARMNAYVQAITNGVYTRNEVREMENRNPIDGLDKMLMPLNMTEVGSPSSPNPSIPKKGTRSSNFDPQPLLLEAFQRITRREANELRDAIKRWYDKGKTDKFSAWTEQFYKRDLPEFMLQTFGPLVQAGVLTNERVAFIVTEYCESHGEAQPAPELSEGELMRLIEESTDE